MRHNSRFSAAPADRKGSITVLVAVCIVVLLAMAAFAFDAGLAWDQRRQAQTAADASAQAAASVLLTNYAKYEGLDGDGTAKTTALTLASQNGFSNDGTRSKVTFNCPPTSGIFANKKGYVEVIVASSPPRAFSKIFASDALQIQGRAVAGGGMEPTKASVVVLDPKKKRALFLHKGGSNLTVDGDIVVNSTNKEAMKVEKNATVKAENVLLSGGVAKKDRKFISGELATHVPPSPDPLASLPVPAKGTARKIEDFKTVAADKQEFFALQPGTYTGPLTFDKNDVVTLAPGIYYIAEGGLNFKGESSVSGSGVMIYNSPKDVKDKAKQGISFDTKGTISLSPPTSGTYAGVTIFQKRDTAARIQFKKDTTLDINGIIYAAGAQVRFDKADLDQADYENDKSDDDEDSIVQADDGATAETTFTQGGLGASIVARLLRIEKGSHIHITGKNIDALKPVFGIME